MIITHTIARGEDAYLNTILSINTVPLPYSCEDTLLASPLSIFDILN
jgi:hypothetical protein